MQANNRTAGSFRYQSQSISSDVENMGFVVKDKVCLVTGSGRSIGKELAKRLLEHGAKVCISDINQETGLETTAEFKQTFSDERVTFCK